MEWLKELLEGMIVKVEAREKEEMVQRIRITRAYQRGLRIIQSTENLEQWETAYRYVEIFGERFLTDRAMSISLHGFAKGRSNELISLINIQRKLLTRGYTFKKAVEKPVNDTELEMD